MRERTEALARHEEQQRKLDEEDFKRKFPAMKSKAGDDNSKTAWRRYEEEVVDRVGEAKPYSEVRIYLRSETQIRHEDKSLAARVLATDGEFNNSIPTKTILVVGMTGAGKSTLVDALVNYIHDVRYEDEVRLRLVELTKEEEKKVGNQAASQTDHITVYRIKWRPGMKINYNLTLIDTPGLGDTRGIDYDKKMMSSMLQLFSSRAVVSLDLVGLVVRAADGRLTAEQRYIFSSVLQMFGSNLAGSFLSLLTFHDEGEAKAVDALKEARIDVVAAITFNSWGIFQGKPNLPVCHDLVKQFPEAAKYQDFFQSAQRLFELLGASTSKGLGLTIEVLKDREEIREHLRVLSIFQTEIRTLEEDIAEERKKAGQFKAEAEANEGETEVTKEVAVKIPLTGEKVSNCLDCNLTCCYPCSVAEDDKKKSCSKLSSGHCNECQCAWDRHLNADHRIEIQQTKEKKTLEEIRARREEFLEKHQQSLEALASLEEAEREKRAEIDRMREKVMNHLKSLSENAFRKTEDSKTSYLDQMIKTQEIEKKPGYEDRISQLSEEKVEEELLLSIKQELNKSVHRATRETKQSGKRKGFLIQLCHQIILCSVVNPGCQPS